MNKIGRITTYPTDQFNKVGFHSYELGFMSGFKTFFVSPNINGIPFSPRGNDEIKIIPFFLKVYPLRSNFIRRSIFLLKRILSIIVFSIRAINYLSRKNISIIHVHSPMYSLIVLWAKITNKKTYITFHGEDFNKIKRSYLYQITSFLYDGVFAISPTMIKRLIEIHGPNVLLVGNGIESDYKNFHALRSNQIIFVGSFKSVKGHAMMIDGFELFLQNNKGFSLLFAGIGPLLNEMKDYVNEKGLDSNIIFLGHKSKEDLIKIYNKSLVFALNSFSEGFPKVILEAVACGCRVVSTKVGSVPDILGEDYPYFIENHNAPYISKVLEKVIKADDKSFVKYENIADNYSWSSVKKIYQSEYLKERL